MQLKDITLSNIASFFTGHWKHLKFQFDALEEHEKEQFFFRIVACKDSCMKIGHCTYCQCSVPERMLVDKENQQCPFLNLLSKENWNNYVNALNVDISKIEEEAKNILSKNKNDTR